MWAKLPTLTKGSKTMTSKNDAKTAAAPEAPKPQREMYVAGVAKECPFEKGSNRASWYAFAAAMVGKTDAEFVTEANARAAAGEAVSYHKRGKKAGQAEDPAEWLTWMAAPKQGAVKLAYRERK